MTGADTDQQRVEMTCPFCGERDFDAEGLKGHLVNEDCAEYQELTPPVRIFRCAPGDAS